MTAFTVQQLAELVAGEIGRTPRVTLKTAGREHWSNCFSILMAGGGIRGGQTHSQSPEAIFAHVSGIKTVMPSNPYDAKGLLNTAIKDDNPVLFIEDKMLYNDKGPVPEEYYTIPLGEADIKREGRDATIVATFKMVHKSLRGAEEMAKEFWRIQYSIHYHVWNQQSFQAFLDFLPTYLDDWRMETVDHQSTIAGMFAYVMQKQPR